MDSGYQMRLGYPMTLANSRTITDNGRSLARTYSNHMIFILAPKHDSKSYGAWTLAYYITPSA